MSGLRGAHGRSHESGGVSGAHGNYVGAGKRVGFARRMADAGAAAAANDDAGGGTVEPDAIQFPSAGTDMYLWRREEKEKKNIYHENQ